MKLFRVLSTAVAVLAAVACLASLVAMPLVSGSSSVFAWSLVILLLAGILDVLISISQGGST